MANAKALFLALETNDFEAAKTVFCEEVMSAETGTDAKHATDFPEQLKDFIEISVSKLLDDTRLLRTAKKLFHFMDCYVLCLEKLLESFHQNEKLLDNESKMSDKYFELLKRLPSPSSEKISKPFFAGCNQSKKLKKRMNRDRMLNLYSEAWTTFVSFPLSEGVHRRALCWVAEEVLAESRDALLFLDFFVGAFHLGPPLDVHALQGLFVLMTEHSLEYPDFYGQLYGLVHASVCYSGQQQRFLELLDVFLSSTHLPAYVAAAFAKRLCRVLLFAPCSSVPALLSLISNLLVRHSAISHLLSRPQPVSLETDPYEEDEKDLGNCKAMESSLWEIKTVAQHWRGDLSELCGFVDKPLGVMAREVECGSFAVDWDKEMRRKMMSENQKHVPLTFQTSTSPFLHFAHEFRCAD